MWREDGHRDAAVMLAALEGVSTGQAQATLANGQRLAPAPGHRGRRAHRAAVGAQGDRAHLGRGARPRAGGELLAGAGAAPLQAVRERCRRSRATSATEDPLAAVRRIRDEPLLLVVDRRRGGLLLPGPGHRRPGGPDPLPAGPGGHPPAPGADGRPERTPVPNGRLRADAFFALITQRHPDTGDPLRPDRHHRTRTAPGPGADLRPRPVTADEPTQRGRCHTARGTEPPTRSGEVTGYADDTAGDDPSSLIDRPPTCSVVVRVDLDALLRGHAEGDECCEIDNQGPIPVAMARDMANDSFLRLVFHRAGDIRAVSHQGRTINRTLRTALVHRDTTCVVPGCRTSFGLEIDHIIPFAEGGPTALDNLALLCHHHHFLKTYEGWDPLLGGHRTEGHPRWRFEPHPPSARSPTSGWTPPRPGPGGNRTGRDRQDRRVIELEPSIGRRVRHAVGTVGRARSSQPWIGEPRAKPEPGRMKVSIDKHRLPGRDPSQHIRWRQLPH